MKQKKTKTLEPFELSGPVALLPGQIELPLASPPEEAEQLGLGFDLPPVEPVVRSPRYRKAPATRVVRTSTEPQFGVMSYGGGVQSTALLVLMAQEKIAPRIALFCNVGDDSEHPASLRYVREIAVPYAAAHGIELHILDRVRRDGTTETLFGRLTKEGSRSIPIPVKMGGSGAPGTRLCTSEFKIKVISRWLKLHGATEENPALVALGISLDEMHRARSNSGEKVQELDYPLLRLRMTRSDCANLIREAGLPVPPKSSCYFCPFHSAHTWQRMRQDEPELFAQTVALEELLNARREMLGRDRVFFHSRLKPLQMATNTNTQGQLFDDAESGCESGYCLT